MEPRSVCCIKRVNHRLFVVVELFVGALIFSQAPGLVRSLDGTGAVGGSDYSLRYARLIIIIKPILAYIFIHFIYYIYIK